MKKSKCRGECVPASEKPQNLQAGILYAVECEVCGFHTLFTLPGQKTRPNDFVMLGDQKPLMLDGKVDKSFLEFGRKYGHCYTIPKGMIPEASKEEQIDALYDALANGLFGNDEERALESFNKLVLKISVRCTK